MNIPKFEIAAGDKSSVPAKQIGAISEGFAALERAHGFSALDYYGKDTVVLHGKEQPSDGTTGIAEELLTRNEKREER